LIPPLIANHLISSGFQKRNRGMCEAREGHRAALDAERAVVRAHAPIAASDAGRVRDELMDLAQSRRRVLVDDPTGAHPIVSTLLIGQVTFTPIARKQWRPPCGGSESRLGVLRESGLRMKALPQWRFRGPGMASDTPGLEMEERTLPVATDCSDRQRGWTFNCPKASTRQDAFPPTSDLKFDPSVERADCT
jgi:hypothetical protein